MFGEVGINNGEPANIFIRSMQHPAQISIAGRNKTSPPVFLKLRLQVDIHMHGALTSTIFLAKKPTSI